MIFLLLVFGVPVMLVRMWVVQHLWTWFVVPTFGIATPSIPALYGLTWVIALLWPTPKPDDEDVDGAYVVKYVFTSVFIALAGLGIGALLNAFI